MTQYLDRIKATEIKLDLAKVERLERFLSQVKAETYPEPLTDLHTGITEHMFQQFSQKYPALPAGAKILDVGCGQGVALELFTRSGFQPIGITLNATDLQICQDKGYTVYEMDQSFLEFPANHFDFIWCRHCLEHSIFPYFTLTELQRVLKPGGFLYIEVPAPDTPSHHEANPNHYSVLPRSMWLQLIQRAGFDLYEALNITLPSATPEPDFYWAFIQQKPIDAPC